MSINIGTCSWNYDSWVGLVYDKTERTAAEYLRQYSEKYRIVEIDSWFYKIPDRKEVLSYKSMVDSDFRFTCKVTNLLTLTHLRNKDHDKNKDFLSIELFKRYLDAVESIIDQIDGIMLEFEYLNKTKMSGVEEFVNALNDFFQQTPSGIPMAIEVRNKNYLTPKYFELLNAYNVMHVFSEKQYMPSIYEVYAEFQNYIKNATIIRLLGGDRKEIEERTKQNWNEIVMPQNGLRQIIGMINYMNKSGLKVTVNVNNHYEGSAPKTIERIEEGLE